MNAYFRADVPARSTAAAFPRAWRGASLVRRRPEIVTDAAFRTIPDQQCSARAPHRVRETSRNLVFSFLPTACHKLQHHLAPVRPRPMLGDIDALPCAEHHPPAIHGHVRRDAVEHRFDVRRHVVGSFDVVHPAGIRRREPRQRGDEVGAHVRIGIFLDDKGSRGVANEKRRRRGARFDLIEEAHGFAGDLEEQLSPDVSTASVAVAMVSMRVCRDGQPGLDARQFSSCCSALAFVPARWRRRSDATSGRRSPPCGRDRNCRQAAGRSSRRAPPGAPAWRRRATAGREQGCPSFSAAFSVRSRAISPSRTARSSGAAWQAQPTARWLQTETSPVCMSSRNRPSATLLKL